MMNNMTDLEICKRIAQIEQVDWRFSADCSCVLIRSKDGSNFFNEYSPLTDKALCFDLMVKHEIGLSFDILTGWKASFFYREFDEHIGELTDFKGIFDENPQRAICLAIIFEREVYDA
jgi:hypothetical protein